MQGCPVSLQEQTKPQLNEPPQSFENVNERYRYVRLATEELCRSLSDEDCTPQSMTDASPVKWHMAHTTWFFETFLLRPSVPEYEPFHPKFEYLFNSYYHSVGERHPRPKRGLLTRPSRNEVLEYRAHVDAAMESLLASQANPDIDALTEMGCHHEQQHQELILTDVKHLFWQNPLLPSYSSNGDSTNEIADIDMEWLPNDGGLVSVGHDSDGFAFDNERPCHQVILQPFEFGSRLVTNEEYSDFINDGGYEKSEFWLSEGWDTIQRRGWNAPLYWVRGDEGWSQFTLLGLVPLVGSEPVCHVSYYEADAFARWYGARLPREFEWEAMAEGEPVFGNLLEQQQYRPTSLSQGAPLQSPAQLFGDVWEWTQSPYVAYPGFVPSAGSLGEYNGKFMCNQIVLRGGSCVTPQSHIRSTYRNFFAPDARWQFSGIRLARDCSL